MRKLDKAIEWIAMNDEPTWGNLGDVADLISVQLIADVFNEKPETIAARVVSFRELNLPWKLETKSVYDL